VKRFGGGFVDFLNGLSGNTVPAPECAQIVDGALVPQPASDENIPPGRRHRDGASGTRSHRKIPVLHTSVDASYHHAQRSAPRRGSLTGPTRSGHVC
jgi:hypothetical protein